MGRRERKSGWGWSDAAGETHFRPFPADATGPNTQKAFPAFRMHAQQRVSRTMAHSVLIDEASKEEAIEVTEKHRWAARSRQMSAVYGCKSA